jgi:hypothetical protein
MGDIHNSIRLRGFIHQNEGGSNYTWMYCDSGGVVTIGIGNALSTEHSAVELHRRWHFRHHLNEQLTNAASELEVREEWQRVKAAGRIVPPSGLRAKAVAHLRLSPENCLAMLMAKINGFVDAMYQRYPWASGLPDEVQFALIDARYNSKGVNPIHDPDVRDQRRVEELWAALHAGDSARVLELFQDMWKGGVERYQGRQARRLQLLQIGLSRLTR